jgi:TDG/mug DNA glycosylase family protein
MPGLRPRLCPRPRILFVGINPSLTSEAVGHHFAGPGNPFWRLLYAARLVPDPLTCADDARLVEWRLALTNIVARATREAAELSPEEFARGRVVLARLIARIRPEVVAFVGTTVYRGGRAEGRAPSPSASAVHACSWCRTRAAGTRSFRGSPTSSYGFDVSGAS